MGQGGVASIETVARVHIAKVGRRAWQHSEEARGWGYSIVGKRHMGEAVSNGEDMSYGEDSRKVGLAMVACAPQ